MHCTQGSMENAMRWSGGEPIVDWSHGLARTANTPGQRSTAACTHVVCRRDQRATRSRRAGDGDCRDREMADAGPWRPGDAAPSTVTVELRNELAATAYIGWGWNEAVALARALDRALADVVSLPLLAPTSSIPA